MSTIDDVMRVLGDIQQRLDRMEQRLDRVEQKVDVLGTTLLAPHERAQHQFASLVAKTEPRSR